MSSSRPQISPVRTSVELTPAAIDGWRERIRTETFAAYHLEMGIAIERGGNLDAAMSAYRRAHDIRPDDLVAVHLLLQAALRAGHTEEAVALRQEAERRWDRFDIRARLAIARHLQDPARVVEALNYVYALDPDFPDIREELAEACCRLGDELSDRGKQAEADKEYQSAKDLEPDRFATRLTLSRSLWGMGRIDEALQQIENRDGIVEDLSPPMISHLLVVSWHECHVRNRFSEAAKWAELILSHQPHSIDAWNYSALACIGLGQFDSAIGRFKRSLAWQPANAETWMWFGSFLFFQSASAERASRCLAIASRLAPDSALIAMYFGVVLLGTGRIGEAIDRFAAAVRLDPASTYYRCWLATAMTARGNPQPAETILSAILENEPGNAWCRVNLALARQSLGRTAEAIADYRRAATQEPGSWAYGALAIGLLEAGDVAKAKHAAQIGLSLDPVCAWSFSHLALALDAEKRTDEARVAVRRGLQGQPQWIAYHAAVRPFGQDALQTLNA